MKRIVVNLFLLVLSVCTIAQIPQGISHQAVIRNSANELIINSVIGIKVDILQGSHDGTIVYSETHNPASNSNGLISFVIGQGNVVNGMFEEIDWANGPYFIRTQADPTGGTNYSIEGISQILSVPYALFAGKVNDTTKWQKNADVVYYDQGDVAIGTSEPEPSAALDVTSNQKGFLPPRMTTEERDAIENPAAGLIIYNTNMHCINFFNGAEWVEWGRDPMDTFECGQVFTDPRDNQQYRTVQIGDQCWFAQNLNYGQRIDANIPQTNNDQTEKYCYNNAPSNCLVYGGLYQWNELMANDSVEFTRGICPDGWRLPNESEWQILLDHYGGPSVAGNALVKSGSSGFDALMNGKHENIYGFSGNNDISTFWTASGSTESTAKSFAISEGNPQVFSNIDLVTNAYGARCLKGLPNRSDPNLRVIDSSVYNLISDSLELIQGIYRYEIIGSRKAKDIIAEDNIVVGTEQQGYLRKVDELSLTEDLLELITSDATFEDAFIEGEFDFGTDLSEKKKPVLSHTKITYLAPGVEISPIKDGFHYQIENVELFSGSNITAAITHGHVILNPAFKFEFRFRNRKVNKLAFYADNTLFENSLDVAVNVSGQTNDTKSKTLAKVDKYLVYVVPSIPPIPIVIVITTKLDAKFVYNFDAAFNATTGYTNTNYLSFGMKYENNNWQHIWDQNQNNEMHPISWDGNVSLTQKLSIIPQISVKLYGALGPYFNLPLWQELKANLALPEYNYDARIDLGLNGNIGAEITIFGKTLAKYNKELFGFDVNLYNTPYNLAITSGNDQTGNVNSPLAEPLKVRVTDNKGFNYVPARVRFSIESGGGSLSAPEVWTNASGYAETNWTLGDQSEQTVKAEVFKANGVPITGSPAIFNATLDGQDCPETFFDSRDGKTYSTVMIGNQCWMKENLNYQTGNSWCFNNSASNCNVYGRLYDWHTAINACPEGWHLPTDSEWLELINHIGGSLNPGGNKLKSCRQINSPLGGLCNTSTHPRWDSHHVHYGTDEFEFSGLPGGYRDHTMNFFFSLGEGASWWSSTEQSSSNAWYRYLLFHSGDVIWNHANKQSGFSVRCVKDQ